MTLKGEEDATDDEAHRILIKQIPEFLPKRVVEHQTRVLAERNCFSLIGLAKLSETRLRNWMSNLHIRVPQVKIFDDEMVVDVKGEHQSLKLMTLNGNALGSACGSQL